MLIEFSSLLPLSRLEIDPFLELSRDDGLFT
jgi:hypothetical protein